MFTTNSRAPVKANLLFSEDRNSMGLYENESSTDMHHRIHSTMYHLSMLHQLHNELMDNPSVPETNPDQTTQLSFLLDTNYQLWFAKCDTSWPQKQCIMAGHIECSQEQDKTYITCINHQSNDFYIPFMDNLKWVIFAFIVNERKYHYAFKQQLMIESGNKRHTLSLIEIRSWVYNTFETDLVNLFQEQPTKLRPYPSEKKKHVHFFKDTTLSNTSSSTHDSSLLAAKSPNQLLR